MMCPAAFTQPPKQFPHPPNCEICVAEKDRARRVCLGWGYDEEAAERMSRAVVRIRLLCGWHS